MKHHVPPAPDAAREVFGADLPQAERYVAWLAGPGVTRGLLGPREVPRLWDRHVLNSVALAAVVPAGARVLDVGSGAGLPGIPLALARPDLHVTLVEPLLRRATFLDEVCAGLDLPQVDVLRARAEDCPRHQADAVVARAVAPLDRLARLTLPLLRDGGLLVALKGRSVQSEVDAAAHTLARLGASQWRVVELSTPGGDEPTRAVVVVAGSADAQR